LSPEEYAQLEENILADGKCRNALIVWKDALVDGHNRLGICVKHGIRFEVAEMDFADREEVKLWIVNNQLARRNLSDAARIGLAMKKAEMMREKAKGNLSHGGRPRADEKGLPLSSKHIVEPLCVQTALASEAGVSKGMLSQYHQILKQGSPELITAVQSGQIKIGTAFRLLPGELLKELEKAEKVYTPAGDCRKLNTLLDALLTKGGLKNA
jgi:DNA-binding transcriptional regulator YdaS (Cro superfamily)